MKKSSLPFDFRDLMNMAEIPPIADLPGQKATVGAAVSEHGLVLVVLPEGGVDSLDLASYPNLVIGPIENDWDQIALLVDNVRSILEPPEVSRLYLRLDRNRLGENVVRMHSRLEASFGAKLRIVEDREVASWRMKFPSRVALPVVPEDDAWATELLLAAAETALFGELAAGSFPSGLGRRDSEDDVRLAGA